MDTEQTVTGDILQDARKRTEQALTKKNLPFAERVNLENQLLMLTFLETDHKRVGEMWPYYLEQKKRQERWTTLNNAVLLFLVTDIITRVLQWLSVKF